MSNLEEHFKEDKDKKDPKTKSEKDDNTIVVDFQGLDKIDTKDNDAIKTALEQLKQLREADAKKIAKLEQEKEDTERNFLLNEFQKLGFKTDKLKKTPVDVLRQSLEILSQTDKDIQITFQKKEEIPNRGDTITVMGKDGKRIKWSERFK